MIASVLSAFRRISIGNYKKLYFPIWNFIFGSFLLFRSDEVWRKNGSLHLPKRPEIPERPRNTGKTSEWLNTFSGDCGEGVGHFNLIFKNVLMSIFEYRSAS